MFHKLPIDIHVHQKTFMNVHALLLTRSFQGDAFESKQPKRIQTFKSQNCKGIPPNIAL